MYWTFYGALSQGCGACNAFKLSDLPAFVSGMQARRAYFPGGMFWINQPNTAAPISGSYSWLNPFVKGYPFFVLVQIDAAGRPIMSTMHAFNHRWNGKDFEPSMGRMPRTSSALLEWVDGITRPTPTRTPQKRILPPPNPYYPSQNSSRYT